MVQRLRSSMNRMTASDNASHKNPKRVPTIGSGPDAAASSPRSKLSLTGGQPLPRGGLQRLQLGFVVRGPQMLDLAGAARLTARSARPSPPRRSSPCALRHEPAPYGPRLVHRIDPQDQQPAGHRPARRADRLDLHPQLRRATKRKKGNDGSSSGRPDRVATAILGGPVRDGQIIEVGSHRGPPYLVRWSDDGRETLFFPGPDAHVSHHELLEPEAAAAAQPASSGAASAATPHHNVKNWRVDPYLFERMPQRWP
jgi:hypothetical protein